jgi:hypothetical protein
MLSHAGFPRTPDGPPRLVKTVGVYNVVYHAGEFYGLPQALGPVDLAAEQVDDYPGVIVAYDQSSVDQKVSALLRPPDA